MLMKRIVSSMLIAFMFIYYTQIAFAANTSEFSSFEAPELTVESSQYTDVFGYVTTGAYAETDWFSDQLDELYKEIGKSLNIDYMYVKILHLLAGGKAVYADKKPNIYSELTVESLDEPFRIKGTNPEYAVYAPWAICPDETIERPNARYLPDAAYSVTSEIVKIMNMRFFLDRGTMNIYFDALNKDVKTTIIFSEAILVYMGASQLAVDSLYSVYEKLLYEKGQNENIIEVRSDGNVAFKEKFERIFKSNNISDESQLHVLATILSFDSKLAASANMGAVTEEYVLPYTLNYTSRENMMLAAMSVVGKVRYVWGGGHLATGAIDGINPSWESFFNAYPSDYTIEGYGRSIRPNGCWCPIHGEVESENGCLDTAEVYDSVESYVDSRKAIMDTSAMEDVKYAELLSQVIEFSNGVNSHRLDGLDCSGYASWLFNQITDKRNYDSGARGFIKAGGLKVVEYGSELLPGDVFSWGTHIVIVVGKVADSSDAYVILESAPNMVKFGMMHYSTATEEDIEEALRIATEANDIIGLLPITEKTNIYNMDLRGRSSSEEGGRYAEIGRLPYSFLDEALIIGEYGVTMKGMTAKQIIQYTLDSMPLQYMSGYESYTGEEFVLPERTVVYKLPIMNLPGEAVETIEIETQQLVPELS